MPRDGHASLSYDVASNRITTGGFDYDQAGNQVRALIPGGTGSQRYQYDAANRLVKIKADDNTTVIATYTYGDSNQRLIADEGGVRTYYDCEGSATIAEYVESGSSTTPVWSKSYVYLGARLLSSLTPNGSGGDFIQYHHPDRLGTRLVTNAQDTTYFEQASLPFGTQLNAESTGSTNSRFTSYDRSSVTGLDYAINRYYDSQQGRFTQVDPIGINAVSLSEPQSLNLYAYCGNDPVNHFDPEGLFWGKLFHFLGKALSIFNKVIKWIAVAALVAAGLALAFSGLGIPGAAFLWNLAGHLLAILKMISAAIGAVLGKIGGVLKGILGFVGPFAWAADSEDGNNIGLGAGALGVLQAVEREVKKQQEKQKRKRKQKRQQEVSRQPVPVLPTAPAPAMEPGPKDLDDRYTIETCGEYGRVGRTGLESICRSFGNGWWANCVRRCLFENFGTSPGGVYGTPDGYRDLNFPGFDRIGPLIHAKCYGKCTAKGILSGLAAVKG